MDWPCYLKQLVTKNEQVTTTKQIGWQCVFMSVCRSVSVLPLSCTYKSGVWWSPQSGASCSALGQCLPGVGVRYRWPCCCWQTGPSPAGGSTSGPAAGQKGGPQRLKVSWSDHPEALDPRGMSNTSRCLCYSLLPFISLLPLSVSHAGCVSGSHKGGCLCLCLVPASSAAVQGQRAVGRKVVGGLPRRAAPSPAVWIHHSLEEDDKQEGISGNMNW